MLLIADVRSVMSDGEAAWRCADSVALRSFPGCGFREPPPGPSRLSSIQERIGLKSVEALFSSVPELAERQCSLAGHSLGIDAATLDANAAMRSVVRRDKWERHEGFLTRLAMASSTETSRKTDLAKLDRGRKNRASNRDWGSLGDPWAKITQVADGRTHLSHEAKHTVALDTDTAMPATQQPGDTGDMTTMYRAAAEAAAELQQVTKDEVSAHAFAKGLFNEGMTRKRPDINGMQRDSAEFPIGAYLPQQDCRRWDWRGKPAEHVAVYPNRRGTRGRRGNALFHRRGARLERPFAHWCDSGSPRRPHTRGPP